MLFLVWFLNYSYPPLPSHHSYWYDPYPAAPLSCVFVKAIIFFYGTPNNNNSFSDWVDFFSFKKGVQKSIQKKLSKITKEKKRFPSFSRKTKTTKKVSKHAWKSFRQETFVQQNYVRRSSVIINDAQKRRKWWWRPTIIPFYCEEEVLLCGNLILKTLVCCQKNKKLIHV